MCCRFKFNFSDTCWQVVIIAFDWPFRRYSRAKLTVFWVFRGTRMGRAPSPKIRQKVRESLFDGYEREPIEHFKCSKEYGQPATQCNDNRNRLTDLIFFFYKSR